MVNREAYQGAAQAAADAIPGGYRGAVAVANSWADRASSYARNVETRVAARLARAVRENESPEAISQAIDEQIDALTAGIERYAEPPWGVAQQSYGEGLDENQVLLDWVLDPEAEHCEGCEDAAAGAPYSADEMPGWPGEQDCLDHCRCTIVPEADSWNEIFGDIGE
jgi:hypothetical protein